MENQPKREIPERNATWIERLQAEACCEGKQDQEYEDLLRAALAMIEGGFKEDKTSEQLIKYWNLRPSEVRKIIKRVKEIIANKHK